jgi:hypothetical protein
MKVIDDPHLSKGTQVNGKLKVTVYGDSQIFFLTAGILFILFTLGFQHVSIFFEKFNGKDSFIIIFIEEILYFSVAFVVGLFLYLLCVSFIRKSTKKDDYGKKSDQIADKLTNYFYFFFLSANALQIIASEFSIFEEITITILIIVMYFSGITFISLAIARRFKTIENMFKVSKGFLEVKSVHLFPLIGFKVMREFHWYSNGDQAFEISIFRINKVNIFPFTRTKVLEPLSSQYFMELTKNFKPENGKEKSDEFLVYLMIGESSDKSPTDDETNGIIIGKRLTLTKVIDLFDKINSLGECEIINPINRKFLTKKFDELNLKEIPKNSL